LSIYYRADVGPNLFDLLGALHATPGRHLPSAVEHRIDEALVLVGTQPAQASVWIERLGNRNVSISRLARNNFLISND
jgi:hypothetical protein